MSVIESTKNTTGVTIKTAGDVPTTPLPKCGGAVH
jgi:uncharacterized protein YqiB (DUF1249 family)